MCGSIFKLRLTPCLPLLFPFPPPSLPPSLPPPSSLPPSLPSLPPSLPPSLIQGHSRYRNLWFYHNQLLQRWSCKFISILLSFNSINWSLIIRGPLCTQGIIVVYDISKLQSFNQLIKWINYVQIVRSCEIHNYYIYVWFISNNCSIMSTR